MPELPEVETVRRGLDKLIIGKTIQSVDHDTPKSFPNDESAVTEFMLGAKIMAVRRRAKVLLIELSTDYTLMVHLKMTGQMVFVDQAPSNKHQNSTNVQGANDQEQNEETRFGAGHPNESLVGSLPDKSTRVIITLKGTGGNKGVGLEASTRKKQEAQGGVHEVRRPSIGDSDKVIAQERWQHIGLAPMSDDRAPRLYFNDQRKFGWVKLLPNELVAEDPFMQKVGPEPLEPEFTADVFIPRVRRRANTSIKAALLDQTVLAGVGNIYADEALWGAMIHPATLVKDVSDEQLKKLHQELIYVLKLSIEKGGSTDKNYVNAEGKKGSYIDFARVFRRENLPCPRCGATIEKSRVAGRGTHHCPTCQTISMNKKSVQ